MKKTKQQSFLEWNNKVVIDSIKKINLNIFFIVILDVIFYLSVNFMFLFWSARIQSRTANVFLPNDIASLGVEQAQQVVHQLRSFYWVYLLSMVLFALVIIFLASILKGIIWAKTTNTKITFNLISKFLGLNLIWMGFWFLLAFFVAIVAEKGALRIILAVVLFLGIYFTNAVYTLFMKKQNLMSIKEGLILCMSNVHYFSLPYIIILLILFVMINLGSFVKIVYFDLLITILMLFIVAIARYYVSTLVLELAEKSKSL